MTTANDNNTNSSNRWPGVAEHLTDDEFQGAFNLIKAGCALIILTQASHRSGNEFNFGGRKRPIRSIGELRRLRPGDALALLTGDVVDVIDVDPRNEGARTWEQLKHLVPQTLGVSTTPGAGWHVLVPAIGTNKRAVNGVDYLARGSLAFLPGTRRPKYGGRGYTWEKVPDLTGPLVSYPAFVEHLEALRKPPTHATFAPAATTASAGLPANLFGARGALASSHARLAATAPGTRNLRLFKESFHLACLSGDDEASLARIRSVLVHAAGMNGLVRDDGESAIHATINSGFFAALNRKEA